MDIVITKLKSVIISFERVLRNILEILLLNHFIVGNQCSLNEGLNDICAVIFPWDKKELPTPLELQKEIFNFHPQIFEFYTNNPEKNVGELREDKIYFHVRSSDDDDEDDDEHDFEIKCLNSIFGMSYPTEDEQWMYEDSRKFYEWLQSIMCPSVFIYVGEEKFNPVGIFLLAQLAPGWVGGAMTAATWT